MENLRDQIISLLEKDKKIYTKEQIRKILSIKSEEKVNIFENILNDLVEEGIIYNDFNNYRLMKDVYKVKYGVISINRKGDGFINTKDGENYFIPKNKLSGVLSKDCVYFDTDLKVITKIVKRNNGRLLLNVKKIGNDIELIPISANIKVNVNKNKIRDLLDGEIIEVSILDKHIADLYEAEFERVIGHKDDPGMDVKLIAISHGIDVEFSKEVLDEASKIKKEVDESDLENREDLRNLEIVTIDCDTTKDRDDAVYVSKLDNGNYRLVVSIADVSFYVKRGSAIYNEALKRCNSFYINNTVIPMLPRTISNGICSLNPGVDRLCKTVDMEIDKDGKVIDYKIYDSVINSRKAMSYSDVNSVINGNYVDGYENYKDNILLMNELNKILEKNKHERNYLNFDVPEMEVIIDSEGKAIGFKNRESKDAEKLIENFMVITNMVVASNFSWLPFVYRVHEAPDDAKVKDVINILRQSGFNIPKTNNINEYTIKSILERLDGNESFIAKEHLLRSMKRARYDIYGEGHYALQLDEYCHFTSPIRRIADLAIHTVISEYPSYNYDNLTWLETDLDKVCKDATKQEKIADDMEKEGKDMLAAEYMEKRIGEEHLGVITSVGKNGMNIKIDNLVTGKVSLNNIKGDNYTYDDLSHSIIGRKTKNKYQIGNNVIVLIKDASKIQRTIDLEVKEKVLKKTI